MSRTMIPTIKYPAVENVQIFSTGSAQQHKEHRCGSLTPKLWWALTSRNWIEVPINVFVIKHRKGLVLFDTGLDPTIVSNPSYIDSAINRFFMHRLFRFTIGPADSLTQNLKRLGLNASDVAVAIFSHLHFDHIGGISEVLQADLLVSRAEWQQLSESHPDRNYFFTKHIKMPDANWRPIDFAKTQDPILAPFGSCYDVMGDGSLVLVPTPGHTVGSLSMLVREDHHPPLLLVGDLGYSANLLLRNQLPGFYADAMALKSSFAKVRELKATLPNLVILTSHDPAAADLLQTAYSTPIRESKPVFSNRLCGD